MTRIHVNMKLTASTTINTETSLPLRSVIRQSLESTALRGMVNAGPR
jgi:hypothetical protein